MPSPLVIFDLETGGVEMSHPVIQLAAIAVDSVTLHELASFESKLTFDVSACDPEALVINGYTAEAWSSAVSPVQVVRKFSEWLKPFSGVEMVSKRTGKPYSVAMLAGYNAVSFDLPRLKALYGTSFFPCSYLARDLLQRVLFFFDERPSVVAPDNFKLSTVAAYFGVVSDGAHDALADCRMTAGILRAMRKESSPMSTASNPTSQAVLDTLQSIDATLKALLDVSKANRAAAVAQAIDPAVASDADLDSQYGDPEVRAKSPRDWTGDNMTGRRFSECPPEYLEMVADRLDYFASKEEDQRKAGYNRKDAARARGWARRLRNGWKPAESPAQDFGDTSSF